jgi:hypothetical protein
MMPLITAPVVHPRYVPHIVRQQWPKPLELLLTQPEIVRNDPPAVAEFESHSGRHGNPVYGSGP